MHDFSERKYLKIMRFIFVTRHTAL